MPEPLNETTCRVVLGERSYDIRTGAGCLARLGQYLSGLTDAKRVFVLSDETVFALHGDKLTAALKAQNIQALIKTVPAGEASKSFAELEDVLGWLLSAGAERSDRLIAFGGGVIGDLGGLAASLMKRGMGLVQVPTTLLAQVDSSVGGKTAINTRLGKNLIGQFYQPLLVVADTDLLSTLPERDLRAGYAEMVKYGLINDAAFFGWLEENGSHVLALAPDALSHAVAVSCRSKAAIVAEDEREGGRRALLNLGHTFGHALEALNGYGPELLHGEAVATGMALAMRYSVSLGLMDDKQALRGAALLRSAGLCTDVSALAGGPYKAAAMAEAMRHDKKARKGALPLILMRGIGEAFIYPQADLSALTSFLEEDLSC